MRVLLIEDQHMVRDVIRRMLERVGHQVTEAANGRSGLDQLKKEAFDLVITDMVMPELGGVETVLAVREQCPGVKVIAMSGGARNSNTDLLSTAETCGADAILHKPFTSGSLMSAIKAAFA